MKTKRRRGLQHSLLVLFFKKYSFLIYSLLNFLLLRTFVLIYNIMLTLRFFLMIIISSAWSVLFTCFSIFLFSPVACSVCSFLRFFWSSSWVHISLISYDERASVCTLFFPLMLINLSWGLAWIGTVGKKKTKNGILITSRWNSDVTLPPPPPPPPPPHRVSVLSWNACPL